jgi:hypothetical protein
MLVWGAAFGELPDVALGFSTVHLGAGGFAGGPQAIIRPSRLEVRINLPAFCIISALLPNDTENKAIFRHRH